MLKLRLLPAVLAICFFAAPAFAEMAAEQRQDVEKIVREYLLSHPRTIEGGIDLLRQRQQQEAAVAQAKTIEENQSEIFDLAHQMVLGNPAGPITLVEFFDYNCGYCRRALSDMTALIEANPDLRVVLKEFPILSESSVEAARISVAVKEKAPESYLKFHQELFSRPGQASGAKALQIARDIGLDAKALTAAANGKEVTEGLQEVQSMAQKLGITGTPSYIIGRELVPGAAGFDTLQAKVTAMRGMRRHRPSALIPVPSCGCRD